MKNKTFLAIWRSKPDIKILKEDDYIFFAEKRFVKNQASK